MARQRLGQHFLAKGSVLGRIARLACDEGEPLVIEIGPGKGALTERLLARARRVVAIEIDPVLVSHLEQKFRGEVRLDIVSADALEVDLGQWGPAAIVGNLPYFAATPIIERTLAVRPPFRSAVFLVQKEVAERLTARPGSREYGYLSVRTWLHAAAEMSFEVKPSAFHPPPRVDSAVVRFTPRDRLAEFELDEAFLRFAGQCFRQKRKTLRNNLTSLYGGQASHWPEAGLRAEQLSPEQLAELYHRLDL